MISFLRSTRKKMFSHQSKFSDSNLTICSNQGKQKMNKVKYLSWADVTRAKNESSIRCQKFSPTKTNNNNNNDNKKKQSFFIRFFQKKEITLSLYFFQPSFFALLFFFLVIYHHCFAHFNAHTFIVALNRAGKSFCYNSHCCNVGGSK